MESFNGTNTCQADSESSPMLEKASVLSRVGAFMIDHVIIGSVLVVPFVFIMSGMMETAPIETFIIAFIIIMLVGLFVYCLKDIVKGQSIGKRAVGIAVRNRHDTSQTPSVGKLFLRNILVYLWPLEFLVYLCSKEQTKIGDKLAGADVYRISRKLKLSTIIISIVLACVIYTGAFIGMVTFGVLSIFRNHPSYQTAIQYIETNPRVAELVGDIESFGSFPMGSVSIAGGHGQAEFTIRVIGSNDTILVHVRLVREPLQDWEVVSFHYRQ